MNGANKSRALKTRLNAGECLERNDSYSFFHALDDLLKTGPTGTNVMDVNVLLAG